MVIASLVPLHNPPLAAATQPLTFLQRVPLCFFLLRVSVLDLFLMRHIFVVSGPFSDSTHVAELGCKRHKV